MTTGSKILLAILGLALVIMTGLIFLTISTNDTRNTNQTHQVSPSLDGEMLNGKPLQLQDIHIPYQPKEIQYTPSGSCYFISSEQANLRQEPSLAASVVTRLALNEEVCIAGNVSPQEADGIIWLPTYTREQQQGWVSSNLLSVNPIESNHDIDESAYQDDIEQAVSSSNTNQETFVAEPLVEQDNQQLCFYVITPQANLRLYPDLSAPVVTKLDYSTQVCQIDTQIITDDEQINWTFVEDSDYGNQGWISTKVIE